MNDGALEEDAIGTATDRQSDTRPAALVANLSSPEIDRLAAELQQRDALQSYVLPYVNKQRTWERLVASVPGVGGLYGRTLGRREPPEGLPNAKVTEAGVGYDFLGALAARMPLGSERWRKRVAQSLIIRAQEGVTARAGELARDVDVVIASYGTAQRAFEVVRAAGGRTVLNYPIAHNDFQARFYAEEAALRPEFAAALPRLSELPSMYSEQLNVECSLADCILVGSTFAKRAFIAVGYDERKLAVIPYGVDAEKFSPPTTPRRDRVFRVLFVGQIGQRKGMSYLFEGYEQFRREDSELHVVGSYVSGREVYERFAHLYRHTPNVPHAKLPTVFCEADVFVFPTLIEGMGLVVLEAMACGVPVITTTHGPGDIVRDGIDGFHVPIRAPEAIAMRLEQLYNDANLREQMGKNAREQALRHTWDTYAERAADIALTIQK